MKKLLVEKSEGIAELIDRMLAVQDDEILLVIPKHAALAKSASNFRLLKREADSAEKRVMVESPDETVVSLAEENGLDIYRPAAEKPKSAPEGGTEVSDIVLKAEEHTDVGRRRKRGASIRLTVHEEREEEPESSEGAAEEAEEEAPEEHGANRNFFSERFFKSRTAPIEPLPDEEEESASRNNDEERGSGGGALKWIIGAVAVLAIAFYLTTSVFGHAKVTINFTKTPWSYQANFIADKNASAIDPTTNLIPAQVFTTDKNITQVFPATGQSGTVGVKAQGTITIYNTYGPAQDLVASTRFVTPDGKIFRLANDVTVPAKPGSITAPVVADQPGPAYNMGPVPKLTIPGFQKIPAKYAGFYGTIASGTTGGFIGTRPTATAADIANAKSKTTAILQADLQSGLAASYPNNFKILDGAMTTQITKIVVSTSTDASGNFSVFGDATLSAIGFDEAAFKAYLLSVAQSTEASSTFSSLTVSYGSVHADFAKGQVSFALTAQGALEPIFSPADFAASIAGKSIADARSTVAALPQLSNGTISVWPVWLWNMPGDAGKIQVVSN